MEVVKSLGAENKDLIFFNPVLFCLCVRSKIHVPYVQNSVQDTPN